MKKPLEHKSTFGFRLPLIPDNPNLVTRWHKGQKTQTEAVPTPFDSTRAREILHTARCGEYADVMTDGEIAFTRHVWQHMPGYTSFYDALCRVYQKRLPEAIVSQFDCTYG